MNRTSKICLGLLAGAALTLGLTPPPVNATGRNGLTQTSCALTPVEGDDDHFFALTRQEQPDGSGYFMLMCGGNNVYRDFTCPSNKWPHAEINNTDYKAVLTDDGMTKAFVYTEDGTVNVSFRCRGN